MSGVDARRRLAEFLPPDVSRETEGRLEAYVEILLKWQKAINLIGPATVDDIWGRHILDSAQILPHIPAGARTLADLGTGAGFPGLVVAALRPDLDVILIESDARKAAFLGEAGRRMSLAKQPKIVIGRIEAVAPAKRGGGARQSRCGDGPRPRPARTVAVLGRSPPERPRYLPFSQGQRLAGRIDRCPPGLGH